MFAHRTVCNRVCLLLLQSSFVLATSETKRSSGHGYRSSLPWLERKPLISQPTGEELLSTDNLPTNWDWRNLHGKNYVTSNVNQHIPIYCGSCWIHGTVAALNDRIKIMRKGEFPDIMLSRQAIMNCVPSADGDGGPPGCDGGDSYMIHKYMEKVPVPDETCMPYEARNMGCSDFNFCRNCVPEGAESLSPNNKSCFAIKNYASFGVHNYGNLSGELAMMKEIYARGPIACGAATDDLFLMNYSEVALKHGGIYFTDQKFNESDIDHVVTVTGWGETQSGLKYWIVRNSWGSYWGEMGWFKIRRGTNQNLIENGCDWAVPTFKNLHKELAGKVLGSYVLGDAISLQSELVAAQAVKPWNLELFGWLSLSACLLTLLMIINGLYHQRWLLHWNSRHLDSPLLR